MKKLLPFLPQLFIILIIGIFFRPYFFEGKVPLPADTLIGLYHPYRDLYADTNPNGIAYKNFLITDPIRQQYPWRHLAMKENTFPLWNPYSGAGEPLFANIQSAVLYPLNIFLLILPFNTGWSLMILLQLVIGGIGMYYYLKNKELSNEASFLGSISYIFSGFFVAWLTWNTLVHIAAWLPFAFLAIDHIVRSTKPKVVLLWCLVFILAMVAAFFAGHLQSYFYISLLATAYIVFQLFTLKNKASSVGIFVGSAMNILVIISVQLIATLFLISQSARATDQQFLLNKEGWFIPWQHLIQFFVPDFFGNPATLNYWGTWNYGEMIGYIGLIPFFFAITAMLHYKNKAIVFFTAVFIGSLIFALPTIVGKLPFMLNVPLLSTSQPTRLLILIDFSLCVLAAYGFDNFMKSKKIEKKSAFILGIFLLLFAGFWGYVILPSEMSIETISNVSVAKRNLIIPSALLGMLVLFIVAMFFLQKRFKHILVAMLMLIVCIDLVRFSSKFNPFVDPKYIFPTTKTITYLQEHSRNYPWRFLGIDAGNQKRILPPNIADFYGLYTLDTYNPLLLKNFQNFAAASEFSIVKGDDFSFNRIIALNNYDSRLVDLAGVRYLASLSEINDPTYILRLTEGQTKVYENTNVYPRAFVVYDFIVETNSVNATKLLLDEKINLRTTAILEKTPSFSRSKSGKANVKIKSYGANSIHISVATDKTGLLILTDTFYPTWRVKIDGKQAEIIKAYLAFRAVEIPKGTHDVIFYTNIF